MRLPASFRLSQRALLASLLLAAVLLASCSSDDPAPVQVPNPDPIPAPTPMFSILGDPQVSVRMTGLLNEFTGTSGLTGSFDAIISDPNNIFLPDVRMNGVPMVQVTDTNGNPFKYTLDALALPTLQMADTVRFEVLDGGTNTPPFTYVIQPSHFTMPPDSTILHASDDLVLTWNGKVERVLVTITDSTDTRLRYNLQVSNYTGLTQLVIPSRDLAQFRPGRLQVGTDILDQERVVLNESTFHDLTIETRQSRLWRIVP